MNKKYEAIFIIKNNEDIEKVEEVIDKINNMVTSEYCDIFHKDKMGVRRLLIWQKKMHRTMYIWEMHL